VRNGKGEKGIPVGGRGSVGLRIDSDEGHNRGIEGARVSRAACVTSEAPGGISNHYNRVNSLMRPYVASNGRRAIDRRRR